MNFIIQPCDVDPRVNDIKGEAVRSLMAQVKRHGYIGSGRLEIIRDEKFFSERMVYFPSAKDILFQRFDSDWVPPYAKRRDILSRNFQ
jgi:hypothetical protein